MSRRLPFEAKLILERGGCDAAEIGTKKSSMHYLYVTFHGATMGRLDIVKGTVDNTKVIEILDKVGCDQFGYKKRK